MLLGGKPLGSNSPYEISGPNLLICNYSAHRTFGNMSTNSEIFIDTLSNNMGIGNRKEVLMVTGFNGDLRLSQFCINKSYRLASYTTLAYKQAQLIN